MKEWESSESSSFILVEGTSQTLKRLESFSVSVVNHMAKTQHVFHLLSPLPESLYSKTPLEFTGNDVLRQLAVQCLRALSRSQVPDAVHFLARTILFFHSGTFKDWFLFIEGCLRLLNCPVSIVLSTEILRGNFQDAYSWPVRFQTLCQELRNSPRVTVMIITGRKTNAKLTDDIRIVRIADSSMRIVDLGGTSRTPHRRPQRTPASVSTKFARFQDQTAYEEHDCHDSDVIMIQQEDDKPDDYYETSLRTEAPEANTESANGRFLDVQLYAIIVLDLTLQSLTLTYCRDGSSKAWFDMLKERTHKIMRRYNGSSVA